MVVDFKGLLSDIQIKNLVETQGMIRPFIPESVRVEDWGPVISYGLSSYGYDIRLSPKEFKVFRKTDSLIDPKNFNPAFLKDQVLMWDSGASYYILPAHSYALCVAYERLDLPSNITAICLGKSTYARSGVIANLTPVEACWRGYLTLELANTSSSDVRIYANEGIVQLLFFRSDLCKKAYTEKGGRYQDQPPSVVLPC